MACELEEIHNFCCWCCSCGGFFIKVKIPKSGYVPGEQIKIEIYLKNSSTVKVKKIYTKFEQKIKFYSDKNTSISRINEFDRFEWKDIQNEMTLEASLNVPECLASMNTRVIKIKYVVRVDASTSGCHLFPFISFPITIGTVPIREEFSPPNPTAPSTDEAITTIDTTIQI